MSETNETPIETEAESAIENDAAAPLVEVEPIDDLYHGVCPSISGRSSLTYAIGRHQETHELHLRIVENSGKGMWFDGWASAKSIDVIVMDDVVAQKVSSVAANKKAIKTMAFIY